MLTMEAIAAFVGAEPNDSFLTSCAQEAQALIDSYIGESPVPPEIEERAQLEVTATLYSRKAAQNGIAGYDGAGAPVFASKDPMNSVYPMLNRWVRKF